MPPKVEYELSDYGKSLRSILDCLCAWGEQHIIREYGDKFAVLEDNVLNHKKLEAQTTGAEQL
ncbi:putative HTH-type transcriptional regulator YtcD [compost metagenome]